MTQTGRHVADINDLVAEYGGVVYSVIHKMVHNTNLSEDIAQEVWLEILKSLPTFQGK